VVEPGRTLTVCNALASSTDSDDAIAIMTGTLMTMIDAGIRD
jgi:acyl-coenzyme A thioesterase PaaI-like protein